MASGRDGADLGPQASRGFINIIPEFKVFCYVILLLGWSVCGQHDSALVRLTNSKSLGCAGPSLNLDRSMRVLRVTVILFALIGVWNLGAAVVAYRSYEPKSEEAYLRNDSEQVPLERLFCGPQDRKGQALVDRAIMAALTYPNEEQALMEYLSPQWQKVEVTEGDLMSILRVDDNRGLSFDIWYHVDDQIAAISFRGTDTGSLQESLKDWTSNLYWLLHSTPIITQYDVLHDALPRMIEFIDQAKGRISEFHTVGHSLGGGLAQYAIYRDADLNIRRVKHAFVFNSSPVTGWSDFELTQGDLPGTTVTRINEYKEILEFPRLLMKPGYALNPRPNISPRFDEYRLNLSEKRRGTAAHEMPWLAAEIVSLTEKLCATGLD
jgi:hypothetical protein